MGAPSRYSRPNGVFYAIPLGLARYRRERLRWTLKFFGKDTRADAIKVRDVDRFKKARLEAGVSGETCRKDLVILSSLFRWAKARGYVAENPADSDLVKRPSTSRPHPNPLNPSEVIDLLAAVPEWLAPVVGFALETGADRGELVRLTWHRNIDRERKLLVLPRGKTGVGRSLPYGGCSALRRPTHRIERTA